MTNSSQLNGSMSFLLILVFSICTVSSIEIPACCPFGYKFVDSSRGLFMASQFECVPVSRGHLKSFSVIQGYHVRESNRSEIPSCGNPLLMKISKEVSLSTDSCIYELDGEYHAITCGRDSGNEVSVIRKCCPVGQFYDSEQRTCVNSDLTTEVFGELFDHAVIFSNKSFGCSETEVIVEYFSIRHDFAFSDSYLVLRKINQRFHPSLFCLEAVFNSTKRKTGQKVTFMARTCNSPSVCDSIPCVRRCCDDRQKYIRENDVPVCAAHHVDHNITFHKLIPDKTIPDGNFRAHQIEPREYGIIRGQTCEKYILDPLSVPDEEHYFHYIDGSLHLPWQSGAVYKNSDYCIEFVNTSDGIEPFTFLCFEEESGKDKVRFGLYPVGLFVSCAFSVLTLLVYLCVPKLQNLPGKILICLVLSLFAAYLVMAIGKIVQVGDKMCNCFAYFLYFSLMSAFSWMNVMCFDIWITFSSSERSHRLWRREERRRFAFYSLYGWGLPVVMTILLIALSQSEILAEEIRPNFGGGSCWFEVVDVAPHFIFFVGPAGLLIVCNIILFILTLKYCNKVKREIDRMQSSNAEKPILRKRLGMNKARFTMNLKLFVVMGVSWILEIISTVAHNKNHTFMWIVVDLYNALQGFSVFLIFVFKWKVWYLILDRLGVKYKNRYKRPGATVASTAVSLTGSSNLLRMKSVESCCSSLLNHNVSMTPKGSSPVK